MSSVRFSEYIWSLAIAYKQSSVEATRALIRNWIIMPACCLSYYMFMFSSYVFRPMGFAGGLLVGIAKIFLLSMYYCWLSDSLNRDKLNFENIIRVDGGLFSAVINTAFIIFIAQFLIGSLTQGLGVDWIVDLMQLGIVIIFNAIPEVVYFHRYDGMTALSEAAVFTRDNWIEWFLPLVVLMTPWLVFAPKIALLWVSKMDAMLPASVVLRTFEMLAGFFPLPSPYVDILGAVLGVVGLNWFMLFRGFLFREFESGNRRQRVYKARQR